MDAKPAACDRNGGTENRPESRPSCPICGGPVFPCRGALQCANCRFRLCEGCDAEQASPDPEG